MADLAGKYQKLAAEYSKLKAQIPVLKKAFLDEQTENTNLKDVLKEKETCVRKYEQEADSLSFRNQQLSRRVLLLQDELEQAESSLGKKKNKHKTNDASTSDQVKLGSSGVFNEELQSKIEENARLHKQVNETSETYEKKVQELENSLRTVELEHSQYNEVLNATKQQSKSQIEKLQEDKAMLEVKLHSHDSDIKQFKMRAEVAEIKLNTVKTDLTQRIQTAENIISDRLPFIDTKIAQLNSLNIPVFDRKHQLRAWELVNQAGTNVGELVQSLSNFYTYSEQRSKIYPADSRTEPISEVNTKYCRLLHENLVYCRPIEQSLKKFGEILKDDSLSTILDTTTELKPFCDSFHNFVDYNNRLLPLQLSSIEEECALSSCPSTLSAKNMELHNSYKKLNDVYNKLDQHISQLGKKTSTDSSCDSVQIFQDLSQSLTDFHITVKEVSKHYNAKVSLEHQLPTATQKLKTTDECIVSSLVSLVTSASKIATFIGNNIEFCSEKSGYISRGTKNNFDNTGINPVVASFKHRTTEYISSLARPCPESVPHKVAVQNRKVLLSSAESKEGLSKQIERFQQRVGSLEQEKEHYMLELQLLKIKYENEIHKYKQLEKEISLLKRNGITDTPNDIESNMEKMPSLEPTNTNINKTQIPSDNLLIGKLESVSGSNFDVETREQLIKNHFTLRQNQLTLQLQHADSKCVNFHAEVRALHKQLQLAEKQKSKAEEELNIANQALAQLKDEHQTTTKSYENQLSMMSEHLAGMNERLAKQKDEIDEQKLLLQGKSKSLKKKK
ncbi:hypothetical protein SNE40_010399 [Patella caerulea]|uniref:Protein phosphatase 1 regulatory subunit 21 n=1 Tax=Patella caerulea TaxID=87958 RepID=A0AAN8JV46_PATCE